MAKSGNTKDPQPTGLNRSPHINIFGLLRRNSNSSLHISTSPPSYDQLNSAADASGAQPAPTNDANEAVNGRPQQQPENWRNRPNIVNRRHNRCCNIL